ncbi:amino acid kinase family protein [Pseudomonas bijieensis]
MYDVAVWRVGTQALIKEDNSIDQEYVRAWAAKAELSIAQNCRPILVCGSALPLGLVRMKTLQGHRSSTSSLAAMAFGQTIMGALWESMFNESGRVCAQILLTEEDLDIDHRRAAIRATLQTLLDMEVVPIISENQLSIVPQSPLRWGHHLVEAISQMMGQQIESLHEHVSLNLA